MIHIWHLNGTILPAKWSSLTMQHCIFWLLHPILTPSQCWTYTPGMSWINAPSSSSKNYLASFFFMATSFQKKIVKAFYILFLSSANHLDLHFSTCNDFSYSSSKTEPYNLWMLELENQECWVNLSQLVACRLSLEILKQPAKSIILEVN